MYEIFQEYNERFTFAMFSVLNGIIYRPKTFFK